VKDRSTTPERGYYVAELSLSDLLEVYRICALLETEAAHRAVELIRDDEVIEIEQSEQQIRAASASGDVLAMTEANRQFHFQILAASRMPRLVHLARILWDATDTYRAVYYGDALNRSRVDEEHRLILQALTARDGDLLAELLHLHRSHAVSVGVIGKRGVVGRDHVGWRHPPETIRPNRNSGVSWE
jgi:DNA-binding GntR family transcriptional regulator